MLNSFVEKYHEIFYLNADERTRDKFLMGSPVGVVMICATYLIMTKNFIDYAKNNPKRTIDFKKSMFVANFVYLVISIYLIMKLINYMIWAKYDFRCMPLDRSMRPEVLEVRAVKLFANN